MDEQNIMTFVEEFRKNDKDARHIASLLWVAIKKIDDRLEKLEKRVSYNENG